LAFRSRPGSCGVIARHQSGGLRPGRSALALPTAGSRAATSIHRVTCNLTSLAGSPRLNQHVTRHPRHDATCRRGQTCYQWQKLTPRVRGLKRSYTIPNQTVKTIEPLELAILSSVTSDLVSKPLALATRRCARVALITLRQRFRPTSVTRIVSSRSPPRQRAAAWHRGSRDAHRK
jgi:hypothetical protein